LIVTGKESREVSPCSCFPYAILLTSQGLIVTGKD
jgi:hypothetical protein